MSYVFHLQSVEGLALESSTRYEIRPRSFGEILDGAFQIYRDQFKRLVGVSLMSLPPLVVIVMAFTPLAALSTAGAVSPPEMRRLLLSVGAPLLVGGFCLWLIATVQQAALTRLIANAYLGHTTAVAPALRQGLSLFLRFSAATLFYYFVFFISCSAWCLFLVPLVLGTIFAINRILFAQAMVLEGRGIWDSFRRSKSLIKGYRLQVALLVTLLLVLEICLSFGFSALIPVSIREIPVLGAAVVQLPTVLIAPLRPAVITLAYYDLRVRKEAFDLEVLSQEALGSAPILAEPVG